MSKINKILGEWQPGDVHTLKWFAARKVQQRTAYKYSETGALKKIGSGVFARPRDKLSWLGAVRAMQDELNLHVHVGMRSALELQGTGHNLQIAERPQIGLVLTSKTNIPTWLNTNNWDVTFTFRRSSLISAPLDLVPYTEQGITIAISSREQAILELFNILDFSIGFETAENYLSSLLNLRPKIMQALLERCNSVQVKRVFLFLAETLEIPVFNQLNLQRINLGRGKRVIVKSGIFNSKYQITVPRIYGEEKSVF